MADTQKIAIRMGDDLINRIEAWAQERGTDRSNAIRILLNEKLDAEGVSV